MASPASGAQPPGGSDRRTESSRSEDEGSSDGEDTTVVGEMDNGDRERLRLTRDRIVNGLEVGHVLDHLLQEKVISDEDVDKIMDPENDAKQSASVLLEILPRRGARAFKAFRDSLLLCEAADYSDLVTQLERVVVGGTVILQNEDRIQVVIRVRPLDKEERQQGNGCLTVDTRLMQVSIPTREGGLQQFDFHNVFPEETSQAEIFNTMASPIVDAVLEGYNGCILCYGKTGSGKTYTMTGPPEEDLNEKTEGIIYRAMKQLFLRSQKIQNWNIAFFVSVLEIYNEKVSDLTVPKKERSSLDIREDRSNSMFFADKLKEHNITDANDAIRWFSEAFASRQSRATKANERSSRSHMVFQVRVSLLHQAGKEPGRTGELYLVDLAGSETAGDVNTDAEGLREGANINRSLLHLKEVIRDLSVNNRQDFKFRRSSLTKLLKRVLTGNSKTAFIVNVDPSQEAQQHTRRSLEFASNAKKVKVKPKINYSPLDSLLTKYLKDIGDLKRQIETMKSRRKSARGGRPEPEPKETFDVEKVRELVNFSVENTTQDFRARLDGLLDEERRELSSQLKVLQENVQQKSELEAQQTRETALATDKLLEEICSKQKQVLEEQRQIRQLLTEGKERTVEEQLQRHDDISGQEDLKTLMKSHLESIRKDVKDRNESDDKNYHEELKKLQINFTDLKTEVSDLTLAVTTATEETRAKKEMTVVDVETSQPNRLFESRQFRGDDKPDAKASCCECCDTLCAVLWYRDDPNQWYDPRGQGAGWVTLLVMFYLVCFVLIVPFVVLCIFKGGLGGQPNDQPNNWNINCFQRLFAGNRVDPSPQDDDGNPDAPGTS